jgi:hypothetical protein
VGGSGRSLGRKVINDCADSSKASRMRLRAPNWVCAHESATQICRGGDSFNSLLRSASQFLPLSSYGITSSALSWYQEITAVRTWNNSGLRRDTKRSSIQVLWLMRNEDNHLVLLLNLTNCVCRTCSRANLWLAPTSLHTTASQPEAQMHQCQEHGINLIYENRKKCLAL